MIGRNTLSNDRLNIIGFTISRIGEILKSGELRIKANNPKDAHYGSGQYFSDIKPGTKTPAQLSKKFINNPFQGKKYSHFVEIDVSGLNITKGRDGVFAHLTENLLDLSNRITNYGPVIK